MICQLLFVVLVINGVAPEHWVQKKFEDYPKVVRYHNCNPCRVRLGSYNNRFESDVRNDSTEFRCRLWTLTGRSWRLVDGMLSSLPIELDFCRDFSFSSILDVNFSPPLEFSNNLLNLFYKVIVLFMINYTEGNNF